MRITESGCDLAGDAQSLRDGQLSLASKAIAQRLPLHEGHHVEERPAGFTGIVQREDVRVREVRRNLDLAQEPLCSHRARQLGVENLHGDIAAVAAVAREVNACHPAATDQTIDCVAVRENAGNLI
jgi:hypothetical protein